MHCLRQKGRGGGRPAADNDRESWRTACCSLFRDLRLQSLRVSPAQFSSWLAPRSLWGPRGYLALAPGLGGASPNYSHPSLTIYSLLYSSAASRSCVSQAFRWAPNTPGTTKWDVVQTIALSDSTLGSGRSSFWPPSERRRQRG